MSWKGRVRRVERRKLIRTGKELETLKEKEI